MVAFISSLDGVGKQMLDTTVFRFYWWSLSHPHPARPLDIFKDLEGFLNKGYCVTVSGAASSTIELIPFQLKRFLSSA